MKEIAVGLEENTSLGELHLNSNKFGNEGVKALFHGLVKNRHIKLILLS